VAFIVLLTFWAGTVVAEFALDLDAIR